MIYNFAKGIVLIRVIDRNIQNVKIQETYQFSTFRRIGGAKKFSDCPSAIGEMRLSRRGTRVEFWVETCVGYRVEKRGHILVVTHGRLDPLTRVWTRSDLRPSEASDRSNPNRAIHDRKFLLTSGTCTWEAWLAFDWVHESACKSVFVPSDLCFPDFYLNSSSNNVFMRIRT